MTSKEQINEMLEIVSNACTEEKDCWSISCERCHCAALYYAGYRKTAIKNYDIVSKLDNIVNKLDDIQETDAIQQDENLIWAIGEVMGDIYNIIDYIKQKEKQDG